MKSFKALWVTPAPAKAVPVPEDEGLTRYKLTDEGLQALVEGKLSCRKISGGMVEQSGKFLVEYDAIVFSPQHSQMAFIWKGVEIMSLALPHVAKPNTLTISGLHGQLELEISA